MEATRWGLKENITNFAALAPVKVQWEKTWACCFDECRILWTLVISLCQVSQHNLPPWFKGYLPCVVLV